ncbi:hypothetical protein [Streptomyces sp. NPDC018352]|uniref:VMAP-C domain-containing protein n=1 Tax=Streptomyces sp. NPDC018352 TaxID=3157194 RepID=UPI0033E50289
MGRCTGFASLHPQLGLAVDDWQLASDEPPLGAQRPVFVRCADREQLSHGEEFWPFGNKQLSVEERHREREARWRSIHKRGAQADILNCDKGLRAPPTEALQRLPHKTVPMLCHYGDHRFEDGPVALVRIVHGGYSVALWRCWRDQPDAVCGEFHRQEGNTVAGAGSAGRLPELVHALRAGLHASRPETFWADGIALRYDDSRQPADQGRRTAGDTVNLRQPDSRPPALQPLTAFRPTFYGRRPANSPAAVAAATRSPMCRN